jgi:hypothetical protein
MWYGVPGPDDAYERAARLRLCRRDQLGQRRRRQAAARDEDEVRRVDRRDRDEVAHELERLAGDQRFVDGVRVRHQQQRVAVGRALGDGIGADDRAGTGPVVDDEGLAHRFLQALGDEAGVDVGRPAGRRTGR